MYLTISHDYKVVLTVSTKSNRKSVNCDISIWVVYSGIFSALNSLKLRCLSEREIFTQIPTNADDNYKTNTNISMSAKTSNSQDA